MQGAGLNRIGVCKAAPTGSRPRESRHRTSTRNINALPPDQDRASCSQCRLSRQISMCRQLLIPEGSHTLYFASSRITPSAPTPQRFKIGIFASIEPSPPFRLWMLYSIPLAMSGLKSPIPIVEGSPIIFAFAHAPTCRTERYCW